MRLVESICSCLKGRISILELMDAPFRDVHELFRIVYLRNEAMAKAEKERQEKEAREKEEADKRERYSRGQPPPPSYRRVSSPTDKRISKADFERNNSKNNNQSTTPSLPPMDMDDLEYALEDIADGGAF